MPTIAKHGRRGYKQGCRCDQCKYAESSYQKDLRQRKLTEPVGLAAPGLTLLKGSTGKRLTYENGGGSVANSPEYGLNEATVRQEIDALGGCTTGLHSAAITLAQVLDDPRATSTKPAAAAKLADLLANLHKGADRKESKLAHVRSLTSTNKKTG